MTDAECKRCRQDYSVRDGCDPTKYCDDCAHEVVEKLERRVEVLKREFEKLQTDNAALLAVAKAAKAVSEIGPQLNGMQRKNRMANLHEALSALPKGLM